MNFADATLTPPPRKTAVRAHRLYFALRPDAAAATRIATIRDGLVRRLGASAKAVDAARWHVSLNFVAAGADAPPAALVARAAALARQPAMPPFAVAFDRVVSWKGRVGHRPLVLTGDDGLIGVEMLSQRIHRALAAGGLGPPRERDFVPHLTLFWGDHDLAEQPIEPVRWTVREFALLRTAPGGQQVLGRWPLTG
ncbi:MAG: putative 2h phosphoesterase (2-5 rna ligase) protein [Phenylobacterium sp.]|jgi:2'-5' RNA ligase|nr:putative 2h phosphoesterase (2-5 rna ligase) protein [Phenylobacterium sp.]